MSDVYEIIEKLSREVCELHSDNQRLRAGLQKIVDADGWWDAPSLARDLLAGKDVT
jgi:hypothetical protein